MTDHVLFEPLEARLFLSATLPIQPMPADPSAVPVDQQIAAGLNGMIPGGAFRSAADSLVMGDFNGDGRLDESDVDSFLEALADPEGWAADTGLSPWARGDFNTDGVLDKADRPLFDAALLEARIDNAPTGDFNMDGRFDILDAPAFHQALDDPGAWADEQGFSPVEIGDFNDDGQFNGEDSAGFDDWVETHLVRDELRGDMNLDGRFDELDGEVFSLLFSDPDLWEEVAGYAPETVADFNDDGAVNSGDYPAYLDAIERLEEVASVPGDFNLNGTLDYSDIAMFKFALKNPGLWQDVYGYSPAVIGDFNADGVFNGLDAPGFNALTADLEAPQSTSGILTPRRAVTGGGLDLRGLSLTDDLIGDDGEDSRERAVSQELATIVQMPTLSAPPAESILEGNLQYGLDMRLPTLNEYEGLLDRLYGFLDNFEPFPMDMLGIGKG